MQANVLGPSCFLALLAGCAPGGIGSSTSESSTSSSSSSDGSTSSSDSDSSSSDATSEDSSTDTDEPPDACPAEPALGMYEVLLDGNDHATDYGGLQPDGKLAWMHSCTVTEHSGALASGETIALDCVDEQAQGVTHVIELLAELDGAPLTAGVVVGQQVELALWLRVWFGGTVAWTLRDVDQNLLLLHYNGPALPDPISVQGEYAPPPEHIAPLLVDVNAELCPLVCPEDEPTTTGGFAPPNGGCCAEETALSLDLGDGAVEVLNQSGAAIPGGASTQAIVGTSIYLDISNCSTSDIDETYYRFTLVAP